MKIGVLALQGDVREHIACLNDCGVDARPVRRKEEIASIDGLVIPGGESTTISKLARTFDVFETIIYEGYGPSGVALLIECLSDNRNRAASDVRVAVTRNGGTMADPGSVSYMFNRKGVVIVKKSQAENQLTEDLVLEAVLEAGAEEVNDIGESFEVVSSPSDLVGVRSALQSAGIDYESAETSFLPTVSVPLDAEGATKLFALIDIIEELDDVQNVYGNFDVSDDVMASLS